MVLLLRGDLCEALEKCGRPLKAKALTNKASPGLNTWPYVRPLLRVSTHFVTTTRKRKLRPPRKTLTLAVGALLLPRAVGRRDVCSSGGLPGAKNCVNIA